MTTETITQYQLEGRLLEVCTCQILCPCWVGEDPDGGTCNSSLAWHFDKGQIQGVDISGLTLALAVHIPGNVLAGNWRAMVYMDEKATPQQEEALLKVYTGQLGGPVADLVQLIGEVVRVERAPITFTVEGGKGKLMIGQTVEAEMAPFMGPAGKPTTLNESVFSTIPGSPAFVSKAASYRSTVPELGHDFTVKDHNAIQGTFRFEH